MSGRCTSWCVTVNPAPEHEDHVCWSAPAPFTDWPRALPMFREEPPAVTLAEANDGPEVWLGERIYSAGQARLIAAALLEAADRADGLRVDCCEVPS